MGRDVKIKEAEVREEGIIQLGGGHYEKNKDFVFESRGVSRHSAEDINIVVEHGLSSENTQSPGQSSSIVKGKAYPTSLSTGRAVGHDRAVWQELNNISLALFVVLNCLVIRCVILCRGCNIPTSGIRAEVREEGIIQLGGGHYEKNKDFVFESRGVSRHSAEDINIVVEHGLSSENTQSPGGSSDTSEGSENSGSFEESGRSDEG
ncbi:hypothetical protein Tco_1546837 [Tanacetum coccineum]